jgi:branched-chain amino acid transport system permease protein
VGKPDMGANVLVDWDPTEPQPLPLLPVARRVATPSSRPIWPHLLGLLLLLLPIYLLHGNPFWVGILAFTYLFAGLAASWNIIAGFGGQFSLAHGVFFGVGAYTVTLLYLRAGISPWLGLIPAALLSAAISALISWPTFRLRGPFFAIATMALNEVAAVFANYFGGLTGGPQGLLIPFRAGFVNMIFVERWKYSLLTGGFMVLVVAVSLVLLRSRLGYYLLAVREDEDAARAAGIPALRVKILGMMISAGLTGVGGGLFALFVRVIDPPTLFSLQDVGVKFALLTLIGGMGTIWGPVLGAALIIPLENFLRTWLSDALPGGHYIVLGLFMILAARFMKRGIAGAYLTIIGRRRS